MNLLTLAEMAGAAPDPNGAGIWLAIILALVALLKEVVMAVVGALRGSGEKKADPAVAVIVENTKAITELTGVLKDIKHSHGKALETIQSDVGDLAKVLQGIDYRTREIREAVKGEIQAAVKEAVAEVKAAAREAAGGRGPG